MKNLTQNHPTGSIVAIASAVLVLLGALGVYIDPQVSAAILGVVGAVSSALTPRQP